MAITDKEQGVWELDEVYNKQNQGGIWDYDGIPAWFGMGKNTEGKLGLNDQAARSSPTQLPGTWSKIEGGGNGQSFLGRKTDGTLWAWGYNVVGELGINTAGPAYAQRPRSSPCQIGTDTNWSSNFICSGSNSFATKTDGTLWSWGYNNRGSLALNNSSVGYPFPARSGMYSSPTQVGTDTTWKEVMGTGGNAWAIKTNGTMWSWGSSGAGALGLNEVGTHPAYTGSRSSPTQIATDTTWDSFGGMAGSAVFAFKTDGTTWSWGYDQYGKLGRNTQMVALSSPTQLPGSWSTFSKGSSHVIATKTDGTLWSWGYNQYGALGQNQAKAQLGALSSPTQLPGTNWSQLAAGYLQNAATKTDGTLWTWGENEGGQLGHNDQGAAPTSYATSRSSPTQVSGTGWSDPTSTKQEFFVKKIL